MSINEYKCLNVEAGFSLVEMLVVVTILALAATFAVPFLSRGSEGVRLQAASSELATAFRVTRSAAVVRNLETTLVIDVDRRTYRSTILSQHQFAADIEAKLTFASGIGAAPTDGAFRFFPDGSSTGGQVVLSLRGKQAKLCVNWLTGEVGREEAC